MRPLRVITVLPLVTVLIGCAAAPRPVVGEAAPAGPACAGAIAAAPEGAEPVEDAALLQAALGAAGQGKLCAGRVFEARRPLKVYRLWTEAKAYTEIGGWWTLTPPQGTREAYRQANVICPEWSALDVLSVCEIKAGARFVMGPGQSARCQVGEIGGSAVNQVFLANDTRAQRVFVENCQRLGAWPPPLRP